MTKSATPRKPDLSVSMYTEASRLVNRDTLAVSRIDDYDGGKG